MRILSGLVVLCAFSLPGATAAQSWRDREWRSLRVDVSALDLSTPAGMDVLAARIGRAVNRICGSDRACRDEAWASTEGQVARAVDRDVWMRRMAEARIAQREACRWRGCAAPVAAGYRVAPSLPPAGGVTVVIVQNAAPPVVHRY
ncbi:UrcA family protein [Sphingomonas naasensis]|uniref:UrcA family protein n=1 Tax=Sphingomonas naasensis TaxID=1344951 RepID=A0A4S1WET8_9SPHN|nr:UrcA family protein [Sphingomonas naasensis]NIJ19718.1 UrcA family protein [Sphingomonas naasensis]TGX40137.1 UrcA family protein [Sphingomonas naasensis]